MLENSAVTKSDSLDLFIKTFDNFLNEEERLCKEFSFVSAALNVLENHVEENNAKSTFNSLVQCYRYSSDNLFIGVKGLLDNPELFWSEQRVNAQSRPQIIVNKISAIMEGKEFHDRMSILLELAINYQQVLSEVIAVLSDNKLVNQLKQGEKNNLELYLGAPLLRIINIQLYCIEIRELYVSLKMDLPGYIDKFFNTFVSQASPTSDISEEEASLMTSVKDIYTLFKKRLGDIQEFFRSSIYEQSQHGAQLKQLLMEVTESFKEGFGLDRLFSSEQYVGDDSSSGEYGDGAEINIANENLGNSTLPSANDKGTETKKVVKSTWLSMRFTPDEDSSGRANETFDMSTQLKEFSAITKDFHKQQLLLQIHRLLHEAKSIDEVYAIYINKALIQGLRALRKNFIKSTGDSDSYKYAIKMMAKRVNELEINSEEDKAKAIEIRIEANKFKDFAVKSNQAFSLITRDSQKQRMLQSVAELITQANSADEIVNIYNDKGLKGNLRKLRENIIFKSGDSASYKYAVMMMANRAFQLEMKDLSDLHKLKDIIVEANSFAEHDKEDFFIKKARNLSTLLIVKSLNDVHDFEYVYTVFRQVVDMQTILKYSDQHNNFFTGQSAYCQALILIADTVIKMDPKNVEMAKFMELYEALKQSYLSSNQNVESKLGKLDSYRRAYGHQFINFENHVTREVVL